LRDILVVAAGGAIGAAARYLMGMIPFKVQSGFPVNTFLINMIGAFCIGLISAAALKNTDLDPRLALFLKTGICGGFTTFSTFSLESFRLMESGNYSTGLAYILLSAVCGILAVFGAYALIR
jgi:CrcB protein